MNSQNFPPFADKERIIAIDFDGVVHSNDKGWHDGTCYGKPIDGSLEAIRKLAENYEIVIYTAKAKLDRPLINGKNGTQLVQEWLNENGIADCVKSITSDKPRALLYIDDNAYRFYNWPDTLKFVEENV